MKKVTLFYKLFKEDRVCCGTYSCCKSIPFLKILLGIICGIICIFISIISIVAFSYFISYTNLSYSLIEYTNGTIVHYESTEDRVIRGSPFIIFLSFYIAFGIALYDGYKCNIIKLRHILIYNMSSLIIFIYCYNIRYIGYVSGLDDGGRIICKYLPEINFYTKGCISSGVFLPLVMILIGIFMSFCICCIRLFCYQLKEDIDVLDLEMAKVNE